MSDLHHSDIDIQVQRYLDGELTAVQSAAFEQRLTVEPDLQQSVDAARAYIGMFAPERSAVVPEPSESFQAGVLEAARRLPEQTVSASEGDSTEVQLLVRRILVAAVVLFSLGLLVYAGLLRRTDASDLIAAPDEMQAEMQLLDEEIAERAKERAKKAMDKGVSGREKTK